MKSVEGEAEKKENLGEKLKRGVLVGKSRAPYTPLHSGTIIKDHQTLLNNNNNNNVSARKLAAALWEFNHYFPLFQMHRPLTNGAAAADSRHRRRNYTLNKEKAPDISNFLADASPSSPEQVGTLHLLSPLLMFLFSTMIWFI